MAERRRRSNSGQVAAAEEKQRKEQNKATVEKAALSGQAYPATALETGRQDVLAVTGQQYRDHEDVDPDPGFEFDRDKALNAKPIDHLAVAGNTAGIVLEIDGDYRFLDVNMALALRRFVEAAATTLNN